ncbi:hypothetical protein [Clostridium felsineum]|uniref:hypothetical protein n=1 Tax=Clostridium felsineum TaxID=36839 RepID=UPI00098BD85C|nr:hypothetical protein [Clostridium felsineum]URZ15299.1 hypothetical protein CLFE_013170 [Clostridium felsineum DSM 794]
MLKLKHLFTNVSEDKVISYCKELTTGKYYKVVNSGDIGRVMEEITEISQDEFTLKFTERIHDKLNSKSKILGMNGYYFDNSSNEITFDPKEKLVEEISKSLHYDSADSEIYAKYWLKKTVAEYKKAYCIYRC